MQCYQQAVVKHVVLEGSDHAMLVLSTDVDIPRQQKDLCLTHYGIRMQNVLRWCMIVGFLSPVIIQHIDWYKTYGGLNMDW